MGRTNRNLTAASCRSAKPDVRLTAKGPRAFRVSYPDADVRGLELRVAASGEKSWSFRYRDRITGKQCRATMGLYDPTVDDLLGDGDDVRRLTLQGARVAARLLRAKVDAGGNPATELRRARSIARTQPLKTMSDLATAYFQACETGTHRSGRGRKKADSTITAERWLWTKHAQPRLGSEAVEDVNRSRVRAVLRDIFASSGGQANRVRALLSQLFNYAISEERIVANPVSHVARVSEASARTRTLADEEMKRLWDELQNSDQLVIRDKKAGDKVLVSRTVRIAIELAMFTLQRRGEVSGMRRVEVDLDRKTWLIPAERTKGRTEHLVPLSDRAVTLIAEALKLQETRRKGKSEFVFPSPQSNEDPIQAAALSHAMADLTDALDLDDVRLHDLRRTGATGIAALGVPPYIVSKVLAHKDGGGGAAITARHYNLYAYAAEKRDALERWSAYLEALFPLRRDGAKPAKGAGASGGSEPRTTSSSASVDFSWIELVAPEAVPERRATAEPLWTDLVDA